MREQGSEGRFQKAGFKRQVSKGRFQSFMVSRFQSLVFETLKLETLKLALQAQVSRQSEISFKPSARVCSKSRTRWRECSNSWMSAHTSACQDLVWVDASPQVAHRVCSLR